MICGALRILVVSLLLGAAIAVTAAAACWVWMYYSRRVRIIAGVYGKAVLLFSSSTRVTD